MIKARLIVTGENSMQVIKVESSIIYAMGYDEQTKTLEVIFTSGGIYRYFGVPKDMYESLLAAESKHGWVHRPTPRSRNAAYA
jgi:hypothetical protein